MNRNSSNSRDHDMRWFTRTWWVFSSLGTGKSFCGSPVVHQDLMSSLVVHQDLMSPLVYTRTWWVLWSSPGPNESSSGSSGLEFYTDSLGPDKSSGSLLGSDESNSGSLGPDESYSGFLGSDESSNSSLGPNEPYSSSLGPNEASDGLLGPDEFYDS